MLKGMLQDHVICQTDPDLWFSESPGKKLIAKTLCGSCWFKDECKDKALANHEVHGVWGGVDFSDPSERQTSELVLCRKRLHWKKRGETCPDCRKKSQKAYYQKNRTEINSKKPMRWNVRKVVRQESTSARAG